MKDGTRMASHIDRKAILCLVMPDGERAALTWDAERRPVITYMSLGRTLILPAGTTLTIAAARRLYTAIKQEGMPTHGL